MNPKKIVRILLTISVLCLLLTLVPMISDLPKNFEEIDTIQWDIALKDYSLFRLAVLILITCSSYILSIIFTWKIKCSGINLMIIFYLLIFILGSNTVNISTNLVYFLDTISGSAYAAAATLVYLINKRKLME